MTNSEERHEEARSRATTGSPMTQKASQTEDLTACTGHPVPTMKSWDAGIGLETKEECDILSTLLTSFKEKVDERLRIMLNRLPGKNSPIWKIFMTSSLHAAIFLGKGYSENPHSIRNTGQKTNCREIVPCDPNIDPRTRIGDLGSVRIKLQ